MKFNKGASMGFILGFFTLSNFMRGIATHNSWMMFDSIIGLLGAIASGLIIGRFKEFKETMG